MSKRKKKVEQTEGLKESRDKAARLESLINLSNDLRTQEQRLPITFNDFLFTAANNPHQVFRNIFQLFHDMLHHWVPDAYDDYHVTEDSIGFVNYDFSRLFVEGCDNPFFADRLFANRLMDLSDGFRKGTYNNVIFLFEGPPGSGKSTFLNNLLQKLEDYTKTEAGCTYKVYWRININEIGGFRKFERGNPGLANEIGELGLLDEASSSRIDKIYHPAKYLEFSCPNHDHPILMIPKSYRKRFLDELISNNDFKEMLFNEKQYEWVLKDIPCNICNLLYNEILDETGDPFAVFDMIYARKNFFSRQLGEGISVFNPGDLTNKKPIINHNRQKLINDLFKDDVVNFMYSYLAKTNNGVLALMDIKENNVERLRDYHGIISDGVHKVELAEEKINTLFLGLVNPADKKHYENIPSFKDRMIAVNIPYILDYNTEIAIYKNKLGENIDARCLPRVLKNFAKIVISTRLDIESPAVKKWISNPDVYRKYVDTNMLLLRMDIYTGKVPNWLSDEDLKKFDRKTRRALIDESKNQGNKGLSGRQSLIVLDKLLSLCEDRGELITMDFLKVFFEKEVSSLNVTIPSGFIDSIIHMYDFNILEEVKEAIYYYNNEQLTSEILDYLFSLNFDLGVTRQNVYTGKEVDISEESLVEFETMVLGVKSTPATRATFRKDTHNEYITRTLAQEIRVDGKSITETELFKSLFQRYTRSLKENALVPFIANANFRRAIQDYGTSSFQAYDGRLSRDVTRLIENLQSKFKYTEESAKRVCLYLLDKNLVSKF